MAEVNNEELERKAAASQSRGVALADETPDELPALLAIAVAIAILVITLVWPSIRDSDPLGDDDDQVVAAAAEDDNGEDEDDNGEDEVVDEPEVALPDIEAFKSELGFDGLSLNGNVVVAEGEVPDEARRDEIVAFLSGQPNVESVDNRMTIAEPAGAAAAVVATAAQASIVLEGTVPDEATREALVARAAAVYRDSQIDDQLIVDPAAQPPVTVTVTGSMTDAALYREVLAAFEEMDGVTVGANTLTLEESNELEAALLALEPIQFASGSAVVEAASQSILDDAAALLNESPDTAIEIGGHTDSVGGEESNQALSQARAESVLAALQARDVTNDMTAEGFGETRLDVKPDDDDPEAQRANRRIEFRVLS